MNGGESLLSMVKYVYDPRPVGHTKVVTGGCEDPVPFISSDDYRKIEA